MSVDKTRHFWKDICQKEPEQKQVEMETDDGNKCKKTCTWPSGGFYRYWILAMLFIGTFTAYVLRVNINIAIIDMLDVPKTVCNNSMSR